MKTQLFLEGLEVDLTDVINIPLTKSFEDLSNPTNINNEFSKTIKIPVSKQNNEVLGKAFRLDRTIITYADNGNGKVKNIGKFLNATRKIPFTLYDNGDLIMKGYAKLFLVDNSVDSKFYSINLFGTLGDLFHKLFNVAVSLKFCPELTIDEIWESTNTPHVYAIPVDKKNGDPINISTAIEKPELYKWKDNRYLMEDCLSGKRKICAKDIKECWETNVDISKESIDLDKLKKEEQDWQIVGVMPTHHGFPNNFDPKSYEARNENGESVNRLFVDEANKKELDGYTYEHSSLVGDGLTEEQLQEFVSWQQKPYIYINKLFALFQRHMRLNPELFDGYELEIDDIWTKTSSDEHQKFINPYWSSLCYTLDFLFNQDIDIVTQQHSVSQDGPVYYRHLSHWDTPHKTESIGLKTNLKLDYTGDKVVNNITLDGYICVALPCWQLKTTNSGDTWKADDQGQFNGEFVYGHMNGMYQTTKYPQLFFTHFVETTQYDAGAKQFCNGGYLVTIRILNSDGIQVNKITNSWTPLHVKEYGNGLSYAGKMTQNLEDRNIVNGEIIDIVKEKDPDKAAVLLHQTFKADTIESGVLEPEYDGYQNWFIGVGLPLRSFGSIPVGVQDPTFEVTVEMMSERWDASDSAGGIRIDDDWQFSIGAYTTADLNGKLVHSVCKLDEVNLFPMQPEWIAQDTPTNYTTLFLQHMDTNLTIAKYGSSSDNATIQEWLNDQGSFYNNLNSYGRYSTLVGKPVAGKNFWDSIINLDRNNYYIHIGKDHNFLSTDEFMDSHHSPILKLANLWTKENSLFNILIEYSKIFGLLWTVDNVNKKIKLLTRLSYFDKYTIEDWSNKVDRTKEYQITPILHQSKYLNFNYDDESDAYHYTMYGENHLTNYGGYRLKTGYEFTPDSEDLYKGIQSSCFSNRQVLTWKQIQNYHPKELPYVSQSPFTLLDADTKDGKSPIEIENWVFRDDASNIFTTKDLSSGKYYTESPFIIIDDTPTMNATGKYMYLECNRNGNDFYGYGNGEQPGIGVAVPATVFPKFSNVKSRMGCLFAPPLLDYTLGDTMVNTSSEEIVRQPLSNLRKTAADGKWIFGYAWERWMNERYNINNKKLTCYINLYKSEFNNLTPFGSNNDIYFANFKIIDNQLFMLNKIFDYNPMGNETTKCEFIQISDVNAYKDETLAKIPEFTLSTNVFSKGADGIYHIPMNNQTTYVKDYMHEGTAVPVISFCNPASGVVIFSLNKEDAKLMVNGTLSTYDKIDSGEYKSETDYKHTSRLVLQPYFTWFYEDNKYDEKFIQLNGETDEGDGDNIQFGIHNVKPYLNGAFYDSSPLGQKIIDVTNGQYEDKCFIHNNTGLNSMYYITSFYEIPLLCKKNPTDESLGGSGISEVINVILPTTNNVVKCAFKNRNTNDLFNYEDEYNITTNKMYDSLNSEGIVDIMNEIKAKGGYDSVTILPTEKDAGAYKRDWIATAKLFTIVVWELNGCNNPDFSDITSAKYAYEKAADSHQYQLYAGKSTDMIHNGDFSENDMHKNSLLNPFAFGRGDGNRFDEFNGDANITSFNYGYLPVPSSNFWNNPDYKSNLTFPYPSISKSRIMDLYNHNNQIPFLIDYDIDGNDGFVYQTFYQDLYTWEAEPNHNWNLVVYPPKWKEREDGTYIIAPDESTNYTIEAFLSKLSTGERVDGDFTVEVSVEYGNPANGITGAPNEDNTNRPYYNGTEVIIPVNTTGYERTITIKISWNNTLMYETIVVYQATLTK